MLELALMALMITGPIFVLCGIVVLITGIVRKIRYWKENRFLRSVVCYEDTVWHYC